MTTKVCTICNQEKLFIEFPIAYSKPKSDGGLPCYRGMCKACKSDEHKNRFDALDDKDKEKEREKRRQRERDLAAKYGTWVKMVDKQERKFNQNEYEFSIKQAKKLKRCKIYFKYCDFGVEEIVSEAYINLTEKGLPYSRYRFYLLMWSAMAKDKYMKIKSSPREYEFFKKSREEKRAIGRYLMKPWYINKLLGARGITIESLNKDNVYDFVRHVQKQRENKTLVGEVLLKRWGVIEC